MHSCLNIQEVLDAIFWEVGEAGAWQKKPTLAALAATCKSFHEPAIKYIWQTLPGFSPILNLLPQELLSRRNKTHEEVITVILTESHHDSLCNRLSTPICGLGQAALKRLCLEYSTMLGMCENSAGLVEPLAHIECILWRMASSTSTDNSLDPYSRTCSGFISLACLVTTTLRPFILLWSFPPPFVKSKYSRMTPSSLN